MQLKKPIAIFFIIFCITTSIFSGCILLQKTEFRLLSIAIIDEDGFCCFSICFNTSNLIDLQLNNPENKQIFAERYYQGEHRRSIPIGEFRQTPQAGTYSLTVTDVKKTVIFKKEMTFTNGNVTITQITDYWWHHDNTYALVGFDITFFNHGDFPVYPHTGTVTIQEQSETSLLLPIVIQPMRSTKASLYTFIDAMPYENLELTISISTHDQAADIKKIITTTPSNFVSDSTYSWTYKGVHELLLPNIAFLYSYYQSLDRIITEDYAVYIFDPYDDAYIAMVTKRLQSLQKNTELEDTINYIASFVQHLRYAEDNPNDVTYEYPRFPLETLFEKQGDCEDKAILTAALLDTLGFSVALLRLPNHMAVGVQTTEPLSLQAYYIDSYYFLETTRSRWTVGRIPEEYQKITNITVYSISDRPILLHHWKNATHIIEGDTTEYVILQIYIKNYGRTPAHHVEVQSGFFDTHSVMYHAVSQIIASILPNTIKQSILTVDVPQGVSTVLKSRIILNNQTVHEKESTSRFS